MVYPHPPAWVQLRHGAGQLLHQAQVAADPSPGLPEYLQQCKVSCCAADQPAGGNIEGVGEDHLAAPQGGGELITGARSYKCSIL